MPTEAAWNETAQVMLLGKTIVSARYMTAKQAQAQGWINRPVMLTLDDSTVVFPSSDDEGNDAGVLFSTDESDSGLPVITTQDKRWNPVAKRLLEGHTIVAVRYMHKGETEQLGWFSRPVMFMLENRKCFYVSKDDEGNDGGALFSKGKDCLPVLRGD